MTTAAVRRPQWFRAILTTLRTATTAAALTLLVALGAANVIAAPTPSPAEPVGLAAGPLTELMERNRCSLTGFDRGVVPDKAIIRTPQGEAKVVSFDHGWAVFSGEEAGELVAVCLGPTSVR
ncbi:hypothetical protein [Nocardioides sp. SYSU DS0651]|uniref:hypothetical protein n=1 Tax=Nocardioides sp. SYSU DS0651 TaxID=3415955 RepID=UPI003F4B1C9C